MRVIYLFRNPTGPGRVSIERVFQGIIQNLPPDFDSKIYIAPSPRANVFSVIRNLIFFLKVRFKNKKGIFHITGDIHYAMLVLPATRTILTVHDLGFLSLKNGIFSKIIKLLWGTWPLKKSKYTTAISKFTKNEILSKFPGLVIEPETINNYVDPKFKRKTKQFNSQCPRILVIGTAKNKNIERLFAAIAGLKCDLRIIGKLNTEQLEILNSNSIKYTNDYSLSDEQTLEEYIKSDIVYFASLYEGFGLPILESQSLGRGLITSNIEPMKTIAGEGALFVDPNETDSIRAGLRKLISDESFRSKVIEDGFINAEKYSLKNSIDKYSALYKRILDE